MAAHNNPVLTLQNGFWLPVKYAIATGRGAGADGIDGTFGHGNQNGATCVVQVYWADVKDAIYALLGHYQWDITSNWLNRTLPKRHPFFDHLYASRITGIHPVGFESKEQWPVGPFPSYHHVNIVVGFNQPHYPLLKDFTLDKTYPPVTITVPADPLVPVIATAVNVRQEWRRWFEWTPEMGIDTQMVEAGSMRYAEGTGNPAQPAVNQLYNSPTANQIPTGTVTGVWRQVPYRGLVSPTTFRADNLIMELGTFRTLIGTVNINEFMGYPAGTLRYDGFRYLSWNETPYPENYVSGGVEIGNNGDDQLWPSLTLDVQLIWSYRDPPHQNSAYRGHNLVPFRIVDSSGTATTLASSWYLATSTGNPATGARLLPLADHRLLFYRAP